ncbi:polysaccharide deacetylase family protein [Hellea balneolensis]|uniref:polysaccharide deacetylase family protein n=1 Tax=Hellea balneolensis TaxID=287478 RepID=UPI0003FB46B6|nr:polysaccharide deacetylase family protein [Hellea balneolensis]
MTLFSRFYSYILILVFGAFLQACGQTVFVFDDLEGPQTQAVMMEPEDLGPRQFDDGQASRLAVLITEDDSHWLALATGLKTIGIPFRMTTDVREALAHDIVMIYPQVTGLNLSGGELGEIRDYAKQGGTLIGTNILGGGLADMFGFQSIAESKSRYYLSFWEGHVETEEFSEKGLTDIKIGSAEQIDANPGTNSYLGISGEVLAAYENGEAAIVKSQYGTGTTYALGLDIGQLLSKGYNRRQVDIRQYYANNYQPTLDALLILLENIYKQQASLKVTLGTVPDGKSLSFIMSHDIDFSRSLINAIPYAKQQKEAGISGTYFIQTKYVRDYNDEIFFSDEGASLVRELDALGAEIASHSVAHSNAMWDFEIGDGSEAYPEYRPFVRTKTRTTGATLIGETRISKFLLDNFTRKQEVESFRPGFLSNPSQMPQVLASTGYKYSSSSTANVSLTHLPFQLSYNRAFSAFTPVFEFPITVEDEIEAPMINRLDPAIKLARQIAKIEGLYVVLIHTDAVDTRLDFQKAIIDEVRPYAWMGTLREFGQWWTARDDVSIDIKNMGSRLYQISLNSETSIKGLTLELNGPAKLIESSIPLEQIQVFEQGLLLPKFSGPQTLMVQR